MKEGGEIVGPVSSARQSRIPSQPTFAAPDVTAEMAHWLAHLGAERRMSAKTVEAYERDARQFLGFMAGHLGGAPTLSKLAKLTPQDVRGFMAARRAAGIGGRSLMRALAGVRSFARDRKSTRLNSSHIQKSRMPSSA